MKKVMLCLLSVLVLIYISSFILAELKTCEEGDENCKIDNAYACVDDQTDDCSSLSSEAKIFTLLATGKCSTEVKEDSLFMSDIKYTAQAILGLNGNTEAEEWLISQNSTPSQLTWYLQVDTTGASTCTIDYLETSNIVQFDEDKSITSVSGQGSCLRRSSNGYWLEVNDNCYGDELSIDCDQSFTTNLLYRKSGSDTLYVSQKTSSESPGNPTTEKVESSCFTQGGSCNYIGSLWASIVLDSKYEINPYKPYLVTLAEDNEEYLPEAFLSLLISTGNYRTELLAKQKNNQYWSESGGRYYDTAVATYPLRFEEPLEKQNTQAWLLETQGTDGCWNNENLRDTAFLLYSLWPRTGLTGSPSAAAADCEAAGNYCMSPLSCGEVGNVISGLSCSGTFVCCSNPKEVPTCAEQNGDICNSNQNCVGGSTVSASDLGTGEICCFQGTCEVPSTSDTGDECALAGGRCDIGCDSDEEESFEQCSYSTDVCCIPKETSGGSTLWIWILIVLILLVIAGIIFRQKLRILWLRVTSKFGKGSGSQFSGSGPRGGFPPSSMNLDRRPFAPRRILPSQPQHRVSQRQGPKPHREVDDVLKKLKEMGK